MEPPLPLVAAPVPTKIAPELPLVLNPVEIAKSPLTPLDPALAV